MTTGPAEAIAALQRRGWMLGVAESLTGGAVTSALVSVSGASSVVRGGVVAYATPIKHSILDVEAGLLAREGAVHPEVALQMAQGVRRAMQVSGVDAEVGLSTTGIAGPDSPDGQPVGTVHIAVVTPARAETRPYFFAGDRSEIRESAVRAALDLLVEIVGE